MNVKLKFKKGFRKKYKERLKEAQDYVDNKCIECMTPFVPVALPEYQNAGKLRDSVQIPEAGKIIYTAPFARSDYYNVKGHSHLRGGNPNAQRCWFEVMKAKDGEEILKQAKKILGGKS